MATNFWFVFENVQSHEPVLFLLVLIYEMDTIAPRFGKTMQRPKTQTALESEFKCLFFWLAHIYKKWSWLGLRSSLCSVVTYKPASHPSRLKLFIRFKTQLVYMNFMCKIKAHVASLCLALVLDQNPAVLQCQKQHQFAGFNTRSLDVRFKTEYSRLSCVKGIQI